MTGQLLTIPADQYHADQLADRPSLSKSIIAEMIERSPAHARVKHPRLNPEFVRKDEDKFDLGTAAHALFLEGDANVHIVAADKWTTNAAKEERALARQHNRTPMLAKDYARCEAMVAAIREQCDAHESGPFFTEGTAERTLRWDDDYGVSCKARLDWIRDDLSAIHDLKTAGRSANPEVWTGKTMWSIHADLQVAWYLRGCRADPSKGGLGCEPEWRFIVAETEPPYAISVVSLAPDALALANKKIDWALKTWAMCLRNDAWPAYDQRIAYAEAPPWIESAWLSRELREVEAA